MFSRHIITLLKNKIKILNLTGRFFFYGYFAVWSFTSLFIIKPESYNYLIQENTAYLLSSQVSSSLFTGLEDNRRFKYSEENNSRLYYSGKYLNPFGLQIYQLKGNFHFIKPGGIPAIVKINLLLDYPRPPPCSLT
jgi:hypothetical protein